MTLMEAARRAQERLASVCAGDAATDARAFACKAAGIAYGDFLLHGRDALDEASAMGLEQMTDRRLMGEPAQYILGTVEFLGQELLCDARALIPRFETELLVQEAIKQGKARGYRHALDLCAGGGCIGVMLAKAGFHVDGCDISHQALELAGENARRLGVSMGLYQGDLFGALTPGASYDLIVSNPPYIPAGDLDSLQREVTGHEPSGALDGGADGLDFYRRIIRDAPRFLRPGGMLLFEMGRGQEAAIEAILSKEKFSEVTILPDLRQINRMIRGIRRESND